MRRALAVGFLVVLCAATAAAQPHPFSIRDMLAMDRIGDPRVSPDGSKVAFTIRVTDVEANRGRVDLYVATLDGKSVRRLTTHDAADTLPQWAPSGQSLLASS